MTTKATDKLPEIDWEFLDRVDSAGDGHVYMYTARGESEDGRTWGGTGIRCDGEDVDVEDIDLEENFEPIKKAV